MKTMLSGWKDAEFDLKLTNFVNVAAENAEVLGLSPEEIEQLEALSSEYAASLYEVDHAKANLRGAVTKKDNCRASNHQLISKLSMRFRANDEISNSLLVKLNLAPHETPATKTTPETIQQLFATTEDNGVVRLRWSRGENRKGTVFIVQTSTGGAGPWETVTAVTKTKCVAFSVPGVRQYFRVLAKRGDRVSFPGNPVVVWAGAYVADLNAA